MRIEGLVKAIGIKNVVDAVAKNMAVWPSRQHVSSMESRIVMKQALRRADALLLAKQRIGEQPEQWTPSSLVKRIWVRLPRLGSRSKLEIGKVALQHGQRQR